MLALSFMGINPYLGCTGSWLEQKEIFKVPRPSSAAIQKTPLLVVGFGSLLEDNGRGKQPRTLPGQQGLTEFKVLFRLLYSNKQDALMH